MDRKVGLCIPGSDENPASFICHMEDTASPARVGLCLLFVPLWAPCISLLLRLSDCTN